MEIKINTTVLEHIKSHIVALVFLCGMAISTLEYIVFPWIVDVAHAHLVAGKAEHLKELVRSYEVIENRKPHQDARLNELKQDREKYLELSIKYYNEGYLKEIPE